MLRNSIIIAIRQLAVGRLFSAIKVGGLTVAFATTVLVALYAKDEYSFDRFIPDHKSVYRIAESVGRSGEVPTSFDAVQSYVAAQLRQILSGSVEIARLSPARPLVQLRLDVPPAEEPNFAWVDPNFFRTLKLRPANGDLGRAFADSESLVMTVRAARTYFGSDNPIGQTVLVDQHPMHVTALVEDLPYATHLTTEIFASGQSAYSALSLTDANPHPVNPDVYTYVLLKPPSRVDELHTALREVAVPLEATFAKGMGEVSVSLTAIPIADIHFRPPSVGLMGAKPPGDETTVLSVVAGGAFVLLVAGINFIALTTARASRRGVEIGVRKVAGASRIDLIWQFIIEAFLYVVLSAVLAVALIELSIGHIASVFQRPFAIDDLHGPLILSALLAMVLVMTGLTGIYPALFVARFRVVDMLKVSPNISGQGWRSIRSLLVVIQFALLVILIIASMTVYRQTIHSLERGFGSDTSLYLRIATSCNDAFAEELQRIDGVERIACSSLTATSEQPNISLVQTTAGETIPFNAAGVDYGFFELFGIKPIAGRAFSREYGGDAPQYAIDVSRRPSVILNESALRRLGYTSASQAVGATLRTLANVGSPTQIDLRPAESEIVGVVPDFTLGSPRQAVSPTYYQVIPPKFQIANLKLSRKDIPSTLSRIDQSWAQTGHLRPILRQFLDEHLHQINAEIILQAQLIAACTGLALLVACVGLFGMSAYVADRRTKEIGIRKAMGADTLSIVWLLVWDFSKPVLWGIAIGWPVAYYIMKKWLSGFAYNVELTTFSFVLATGLALLAAWATVSGQALLVARANTARALRYE